MGGIELPNQEKIRTLREKETYKCLRILEADTTKQVEIKEKIFKVYFRRRKKLLKTKLYCRNLIKRINTWAVPLVRYSGWFLKWMREELQKVDQRTRKLMMMYKALHPRDDKDSMCQEKKGEEDSPETKQTTKGSTEQQYLGNKNGKKNNCLDISSDKQPKSHTRRLGCG